MKQSELRQIIKEEISKVLNEKTNTWDNKSIKDFFTYLKTLSIEVMPQFGTNISGTVTMKINRKKYIASFNAKKSELVFAQTVESDLASVDFVNYLDNKGADEKYDYIDQGNLAIFEII